ncbi:MAG: hypothetical protein MUO62_05905, partial [Anaerolineales bacterium]|nr:hypothetical protein [Anaerolineales bacterium]
MMLPATITKRKRLTALHLWEPVQGRIDDYAEVTLIIDDSVQDKRYSRSIELVKLQYTVQKVAWFDVLGSWFPSIPQAKMEYTNGCVRFFTYKRGGNMNGRAYNIQSRWVIIGCLCITVFGGILFGGIKFSKWGKQVSLALAAPPETGEGAIPSVGSFDPQVQRGNASTQSTEITSIASSTITTKDCYQSGDTWTMCFTVHNASPDSEWLDQVRLTFPDFPGLGAWAVACNLQDASDSNGSPVNMNCTINSGNEVVYADNDLETTPMGEISTGASWMFCV